MTNDEVEQTAVDHVKHLLLGKFEAKRADEYWVKQNTEPKWLKVMIKQPVWRTALYELLERNSGSITLVFAIKVPSSPPSPSHSPLYFFFLVCDALCCAHENHCREFPMQDITRRLHTIRERRPTMRPFLDVF